MSATTGDASAPAIIKLKRQTRYNRTLFLRDVGTGGTITNQILQRRINKTMLPLQTVICKCVLYLRTYKQVHARSAASKTSWPTHSPTLSEQCAGAGGALPPRKQKVAECGTPNTNLSTCRSFRVQDHLSRNHRGPPAAWCSRMKTVFTRHATSLYVQRSVVRSVPQISRIMSLNASCCHHNVMVQSALLYITRTTGYFNTLSNKQTFHPNVQAGSWPTPSFSSMSCKLHHTYFSTQETS